MLGVALASTLQLSPEVMAEVWEAHSLNKQNLTELTMHQFEAYKNELIKASSAGPTPDIAQSSGNKRGAAMVSRKRESPPATMVTPTSSQKRQKQPSPDVPTSSVDQLASKGNVPSPVRSSSTAAAKKVIPNLPKYEERTKVGHVVVSYPAGSVIEKKTDSKQRRCILTTKCGEETNKDDDVTRNNIKEPYRHMFTTLEDRANALERQLVRTKTAIIEDIEKKRMNKKNQAGASDEVETSFEEVNVPRQHPSTCVGRICNEAHNGKLNSTSVVLEGSSSSCGGARVNVDLAHMQKKDQQLNGYSLFPGQIVAIEGINGTGRKITATKIKEGATLPPATSSAQSLQKYYSDDEEPAAPVKVISACGPFTTAKSMDYAPFLDLMNVVLEHKPDVVILTGPFVDVRQEAVQSGRVTLEEEDESGQQQEFIVDYETLFSQRITAVLEEVFEEDKTLATRFILVPALEDAVAKFV